MSLGDLQLPKVHVQVGEAGFDVRGLSFSDVAALLASRKDDLLRIVELYERVDGSGDDPLAGGAAGVEFLNNLLVELPEFVAHVIATAADEPDKASVVLRLPLPSQLDALMAVGRATFEDEVGLKKFVENVILMLETLRAPAESLPTKNSQSGLAFSASS